MNILFIAQNYHPFVGGVETQCRLFAHELVKRHRVEVAAGNFLPCRLPARLAVLHTNLLTPAYQSYQDGDVPVHALTPGPLDRLRMLPIGLRAAPGLRRYAYHGLNRFGYGWFRAVYLPRLKALMRGMDVVHSLAGGCLGWTAQAAARELGIPFVCTPYAHPGQWGDGPLDVAYYQGAQAVIALLESDRDFLASLGVPEQNLRIVGVVPIVPDTTDPVGFRERHGLGRGPAVLYVGRMMPQKGAKAILDAAPRVWERAPDTRFVFIGPGTPESEEWFRDCDPRIRYLGKVSDQEKGDALAACDLFCMPSMSEILPAVYLEAWSFGKAVIGGNAHGLSGLIEGNGGGVTVEQDAASVSRAVLDLLSDAEKRACMGQRGRAVVERQYSLRAVAGSLETLYAGLRHAHSTSVAASR